MRKPSPLTLNFEPAVAALLKANRLIADGSDLSSLSENERRMVTLQPAQRYVRTKNPTTGAMELAYAHDGSAKTETNPHAGRVGFTPRVLLLMRNVLKQAPAEIGRFGVDTPAGRQLISSVTSAHEALQAARSTMTVEPELTIPELSRS